MKALFTRHVLAATPETADVIIAVDVSNQAFRSAFAYKELSANGKPSGHVFGTAVSILTAIANAAESKGKTAFLTFFYDNKSKRKYEIYADYKAGRESREQLGFDPVHEVKLLCNTFPGLSVSAPDEEADDVLASFINQRTAFGFKAASSIVVLSSDKDLWQLRSPNISFCGNKGHIAQKEDFEDAFGEYAYNKPHLISLLKAIYGDASDNIPKIPRLMTKQVASLFGKCVDATPEEFYSLLEVDDNRSDMTEATYQKLKEHRDLVERNFKLTRLEKNLSIELQPNKTSKELLTNLLLSYSCNSLVNRIPSLFL